MRPNLIALALFITHFGHAQDHSAHEHSVTQSVSQARGSSSPANAALLHEHGGMPTGLLIGERLEYSPELDLQRWEAQGWYGVDLHKVWVKTEGEFDAESESIDHAEVQLLYSQAIAPYWDVQGGVRVDAGEGPQRHQAVIGLMGLAPYWFELDAAAFLSERGDISARVEAEYDMRFTQRLILQPRLELNYEFGDDRAVGIGKGVREASFGLRLRYEWRRQLAPYIGVEHRKSYGGTARLQEVAGHADEVTTWLVGLRLWY